MGVGEKNPSRLILVASGTLSWDSKGWALENNDHLPESLELIIVRNPPTMCEIDTPNRSCKCPIFRNPSFFDHFRGRSEKA